MKRDVVFGDRPGWLTGGAIRRGWRLRASGPGADAAGRPGPDPHKISSLTPAPAGLATMCKVFRQVLAVAARAFGARDTPARTALPHHRGSVAAAAQAANVACYEADRAQGDRTLHRDPRRADTRTRRLSDKLL
jgi:hypothetical protein